MSYTPEQLDAINTHDCNLIVTAGAGSGKTRVLVDRFVALLEAHPDWPLPSLVAITFTEKAAREMRDRVRQAIEGRISAASEVHDNAAIRRWRDHQAALDSARIGTIHSLCTSILRANAAEVEIDPAFEVLDEIEATILRGDAVEQTLTQISEGGYETVRLLSEYDVQIVSKALLNQIVTPDGSLPVPFDYFGKWQIDYHHIVAATLDRLRLDEAFGAAVRWGPVNGWPDNDKLLASWEVIVINREAVFEADTSPEQVIATLTMWRDGINLQGGAAAAWGGKDQLDIAKANLKFIRAYCDNILEQLGAFGDADNQAADLLPLWGEAIRAAKDVYKELKRRRRVLDFDDLEALTRKLLRNSEVAARYQNREFRHVLVDEFQDTNAAQRDIIKALAGVDQPGSLFVVGDPRQSIYQFRGADVRVFDAVRAEVLTAGGREILLNTSFRTHDQLLNGFNSLFARLMVRPDGPNADFAVTLGTPMQSYRPAHQQGCLELILINKAQAPKHANGADDLRHWEAKELAQRLQAMVEGETLVWDKAKDRIRPLAYGDIALLFQASKNMPIVEEAFKTAKIPYVTVAGKGYYNRPEVWDLLNLLKALYNPADDLALASALRSPLYNLSDDDLFALRLQRPHDHLALWTVLTAKDHIYDPVLPDPEQVAFARESLLRLRGVAGRMTIAELLVRALDETAYLATLSGLPDGARRIGNVEKLLEVARRSGRVVLGEFTQYLQDLTEREAREGEALVATEGAVQLMTVHASKGLEFPVVALFDASWNYTPPLESFVIDPVLGPVCSVRDEDGETIKPFAFRQAERYAAEREAAERIRLLYVAMTRAQDYVIVSGRDDASKGWLSQLLSALNLPTDIVAPGEETLVPFEWGNCLVRVPAYPSRSISSDSESTSSERSESIKAWDQLTSNPIPDVQSIEPSLLARVHVDRHAPTRVMSATEIAVLGEAKASGRLATFRQHILSDAPTSVRQVTGADFVPGVSRRIVGEVVHEALRWWHLPGNTEKLAEFLESYAWERGIADVQLLQIAINEATDLLQRTERSRIVTLINEAQPSQVYRELPFTFMLGSRTINGIIDVLFFSKYQRWHIVDYKTSAVPADQEEKSLTSRLRDHAVRYHPQVGIYAAAVEAMTGQSPDVHIHYIRYVQTIDVDRATWKAVLDNLDSEIVAALDEPD